MNYGDEYIDVTDPREPVLPDYEEWLKTQEMTTEEKDNMMEKYDDTTSNNVCAKAPF